MEEQEGQWEAALKVTSSEAMQNSMTFNSLPRIGNHYLSGQVFIWEQHVQKFSSTTHRIIFLLLQVRPLHNCI